MKKSVLIILSAAVFVISWAALHDILKKNETDYTAEYIFLLFSSVFYVLVIYFVIRVFSKRRMTKDS